MASEAIGTVRVELTADPSGITQGIEDASASLTRVAAIGNAIGDILAEAFIRAAEAFTDMASEIVAGEGDVWDKLSTNTRNAVTLVHNSLKDLQEDGTNLIASITERVAPGFAALAERFADVAENSGLAKVAIELAAGALKLLATGVALGVAGLEILASGFSTVAGAASAFGRAVADAAAAALHLDWSGVQAAAARGVAEIASAMRAHLGNVSETFKETGKVINDIWNEAAISAQRAGPAIQHEIEGLDRYMHRLAAEAAKVFQQTRTPFEQLQFQLDRLNLLLGKGLISWDTYQRAVQMARDKISGVQKAMQDVGQAFESAFVDAVTATRSFSDALKQLGKDLLRIAAQQVFRQTFGQLLGFTGASVKSGFGSAFPGFASGGSFTVGGAGGIDSQLVAFKASPGEQVHVGKAPPMGGGPTIVQNITFDSSMTAADKAVFRAELERTRQMAVIEANHSVRESIRRDPSFLRP